MSVLSSRHNLVDSLQQEWVGSGFVRLELCRQEPFDRVEKNRSMQADAWRITRGMQIEPFDWPESSQADVPEQRVVHKRFELEGWTLSKANFLDAVLVSIGELSASKLYEAAFARTYELVDSSEVLTLSIAQQLRHIGYVVDEPGEVTRYVREHNLLSLLRDMRKALKKYLWDDVTVSVRVAEYDDDESQLDVMIAGQRPVEDAVERMDRFGMEWWINEYDRAPNKINVVLVW